MTIVHVLAAAGYFVWVAILAFVLFRVANRDPEGPQD